MPVDTLEQIRDQHLVAIVGGVINVGAAGLANAMVLRVTKGFEALSEQRRAEQPA